MNAQAKQYEPEFDPVKVAREMLADESVLFSPQIMRKTVDGLLQKIDGGKALGVQPGPVFMRFPYHVPGAINTACFVVHDWARKKGWWDKPEWRVALEGLANAGQPREISDAAIALAEQPVRNKGELLALIHSEASECLEALRKPGTMDDKVPELTGEEAELADIVIRIFDYCGAYGIDLGTAIQRKHEYNITRPHKHGKAF